MWCAWLVLPIMMAINFWGLGLVLLTVCVHPSLGQRTLPGWVAADPSTFSVFARGNPLQFVKTLATMPLETQRLYLKMIGHGLKEKLQTDCNIFGGEESCMELPQNTTFSQICPEHELKVDCAYYREDIADLNSNPVIELRELMKKKGMEDLEASCEACFENQRKLWCAQLVPKCGSFSNVVEQTILPAISKMLTAEDTGKTKVLSLAEALPSLQQAMALSLPCREMCLAIQSSCGCGKVRTFGELLDTYVHATGFQKHLPQGFTEAVFGELFHKPLCDLFQPSNAAGFVGHCLANNMSSTCKDEKKWCKGDANGNIGPSIVEQLIAAQLAKGIFGWTDSPSSGLMLDEQEVEQEEDNEEVQKLEHTYLVRATALPDKGRRRHLHAGWLILGLGIGALLMVVLQLTWYAVRRRDSSRQEPWEGPVAEGYVPMAIIEEAPEEETLLTPQQREGPL
eukprot:jgi/Botrbrau1/2173/Bobra.101_2s0013.2